MASIFGGWFVCVRSSSYFAPSCQFFRHSRQTINRTSHDADHNRGKDQNQYQDVGITNDINTDSCAPPR
jgi:hypothetical protein